MRGLVRVARVLRLVVHVSGWWRAGFASTASSSSPRAPLLADSSQLALALGDGLGGESQGQFEQVNLTPEGIYLEGRVGGSRRREAWGDCRKESRRRSEVTVTWRRGAESLLKVFEPEKHTLLEACVRPR